TLFIFGERNFEPFAIGGRLLMGERQSPKRFRQSLGGGALGHAPSAGNKIIGTSLLRPKRQFHRLRDAPAPIQSSRTPSATRSARMVESVCARIHHVAR